MIQTRDSPVTRQYTSSENPVAGVKGNLRSIFTPQKHCKQCLIIPQTLILLGLSAILNFRRVIFQTQKYTIGLCKRKGSCYENRTLSSYFLAVLIIDIDIIVRGLTSKIGLFKTIGSCYENRTLLMNLFLLLVVYFGVG